jgi:hypothetical protein
MQIKPLVVAILAVCLAGTATAVTEKPARGAMAQPRAVAFTGVAHEPMDPGPAYRRYTGKVTALGSPDEGGRIYSFRAMPVGPGVTAPAANELRGWRLTILAGKRFASAFEVKSNTATEITVAARDGPLNGLAVSDVFIVEAIPASSEPAKATTQTGT